MELENRKEHVLRCIKLGMDLNSSMYCAECTASEIDFLTKDEEFTAIVKTYQSIEEYNLLVDFELARGMQVQKGNTSATQWKLERTNKERWTNSTGDQTKGQENSMVIILPSNGREQ